MVEMGKFTNNGEYNKALDKFHQELTKKDQEDLDTFRTRIGNILSYSRSPQLEGIRTEELTEEDRQLFTRFELGRLSLEDIARQEKILANFKEAEASMKLLNYMRFRLESAKV